MGVDLSSSVSDRMMESGLRLHQERFRLDTRKSFFKHPRKTLESSFLEVFKTHADVVLRYVVQCQT